VPELEWLTYEYLNLSDFHGSRSAQMEAFSDAVRFAELDPDRVLVLVLNSPESIDETAARALALVIGDFQQEQREKRRYLLVATTDRSIRVAVASALTARELRCGHVDLNRDVHGIVGDMTKRLWLETVLRTICRPPWRFTVDAVARSWPGSQAAGTVTNYLRDMWRDGLVARLDSDRRDEALVKPSLAMRKGRAAPSHSMTLERRHQFAPLWRSASQNGQRRAGHVNGKKRNPRKSLKFA
jgi:hypothetical protein